ncbi:hypothetical protein [Cohnella sp.]|uniref:hypothetical protein n=1 Tax=Cohnella sp. TaxID=1883426 RepID=UPI003569FA88
MRVDMGWLERQFEYSERHGILIPSLTNDWDELNLDHQTAVLAKWEMIRGNIPEHVMRFEAAIRIKTQLLFNEDDFLESCRINDDIADLASRINDLHIWFRTQQDLDRDTKQHSG